MSDLKAIKSTYL